MSNKAYPLHWPEAWPRTKTPAKSQFKTSLSGALNNVEKSIELFGKDSGKKATNVIISSNVTLGQQRPADAGVVAYFDWDDISTCIAVDRYAKVEENLQAIHHCIEAERTKLRHGGLNLVRAAFRGYAALPPPSAGTEGREWWEILKVGKGDSKTTVQRAYKVMRALYHPDKPTGDAHRFNEVQQAWEQYNNEQ